MSTATATNHSESRLTSPLQPRLPATGSRLRWSRLYGDSLPLALARAALAHDGLMVVITPDSQEAEQLQQKLAFFCGERALDTLCFPDWETLPYDRFSPHQDIISERLETLYRLPRLGKGILLVSVATLLQRLPPPAFLDQYSLLLDTGSTLDLDAMRGRLERAGYRCVAQVLEHGEFAVRGSLLDLFPMGSGAPFRIDLFDDQIESIRTFDPDTQRSLDKVTRIRLLPAREFPADEAAITRFRQAFRSQFEGDPQRAVIYRDVSNGLMPAGIEYYLPLFLEQTASLFDYLPASACLVHSEDAHTAIDSFRDEIAERYESLRYDIERPLLPPQCLYLSEAESEAALCRYGQLDIQRAEALDSDSAALAFATRALPALRVTARAEGLEPASVGFTVARGEGPPRLD